MELNMSPRPCEALREIQLGNKRMQDFATPQVFKSGLLEQYGVTIADLRQHLRNCKSCAASMQTAQSQLRQDDEKLVKTLSGALEAIGCIVKMRLGDEDMWDEVPAKDTAIILPWEDNPEEDIYAQPNDVWDNTYYEEILPRVRLWEIKANVVIGGIAWRWLETLVPVDVWGRQCSIDDGKVTDIRILPPVHLPDLVSQLQSTGEMPRLLYEASPHPGSRLVRALLLHQAFHGLLAAVDVSSLFYQLEKILDTIDTNEQTFGVDWNIVWADYSALAESIVDRLLHRVDTRGTIQVRAAPSSLGTVSKPTIDMEQEMADLRHGQTATMALLMDMVEALSGIEEKLRASPARAESAELNETPLSDLISAGESDRLEFKASLRWDYKLKQVNKELTKRVAIAMAGMLNNRGGTVLIGVEDNGKVCGIEQDWTTLKREDQDGFGQAVSDTISEFLGLEFADLFKTTFERCSEKILCRISVRASLSPVFLRGENGREFYIRAGNTTRRLDSQATHSYIQHHWRQRD
jgi:hypothetical protein